MNKLTEQLWSNCRARYARSVSVCVIFTYLAGTGCFEHRASASTSENPNIVIMLVDDMGVMDSSVPCLVDNQGSPVRHPLNERYHTPHLQELAKQGIRFSDFYAMSVCSPTRVSLMTGKNSARHRTTNWINPSINNAGPEGDDGWNWLGLGKSDVTLARLLQQHGYRTIHIGKGHFGPNNSEGSDPVNLGFDVNIAGTSIGSPGSYYGEDSYGLEKGRGQNAVPHLDAYHGKAVHLTEALTIEAKRQMTEAVGNGIPFLLYFPQYAVHGPFQVDKRFEDRYKEMNLSPQALAFATMIEGVDQSLGALMEHLTQLGVAENTLVLFLGDNGSDAPLGHEHQVACAAPLRGKKGSHYEGGMRTTFIAAWARPEPQSKIQQRLPIAQNAVQSQMANVCDLFPTLLEMLAIQVPENHVHDGQSLTKLLIGQHDAARSDEFVMHYPHAPHRSNYFTVFRNGDWKLIYHYFPSDVSKNSHYELYNLALDPFEQDEMSNRNPEILSQMCRGLQERLEEQTAGYPQGCDGVVQP